MVIAMSMVMMYITSFGINVLISAIVTDLGTTVATLQAVIVAASFIAGSLMVTAGRLGDKFGRKKIFILGVAIYTIGLTVVVLSPNTTVFAVAWGLIWPSGMVLVIPTSIALIMHFYTGAQRAAAFGLYGAVLSAVSALAPVVVGALANAVGWRLALALSPLAGAITLVFAFSLPETDGDARIRIDIPSVLLSLLGFGVFLVATTLAGRYGWVAAKRPLVIGGEQFDLGGLSVVPILYLLSVVLLAVFLWRGARLKERGEDPLLDGSLLRNIPFSIGMINGAVFYLVNAGLLFAVSVFLQAGVKLDPLQTALTTLPFTAVLAILSFATPGLGRRIAPKWIVVIGCVIGIIGLRLLEQQASMTMSPGDVFGAMVVIGAGFGLVMAQVGSITMASVPPEHSGGASGLSETMKEILGQGFAVAFAGSILFGAVYASMVGSYSELESLELSPEQHIEIVVELEDRFQSISDQGEAEFVASLPPKTRDVYSDIVTRAGERGLGAALLAMQLFLGLCIFLAVLLPGTKIE